MGNALDTRETSRFNRRAVLGAIRRNDRTARGDISRPTGLGLPPVGRIVARPIDAGFVVAAAHRRARAATGATLLPGLQTLGPPSSRVRRPLTAGVRRHLRTTTMRGGPSIGEAAM